MDSRPHPDLLWLWAKKIKELRPNWDVAWSPQPRKDKKLWVRIAEVGEIGRDDKDKLQAIENESHPLPAYLFHQLEPQWAFELVITGISHYDHEIVYALDQYIHHTFVDAERNSLLQGSCTQDDYYCFTMRDWQATKEVILQARSIENHFAQQKLSKPVLIYQHNMGSTYTEKRGTSEEVKKAAGKLGIEVDAMRKEMDEMRRETRQGFAAANQKFELMNTNMMVLTSPLSTHSFRIRCMQCLVNKRKR